MGFVAAGIDMQGIHAHFFEFPGDPQALVRLPAVGQVMRQTEAIDHRKVFAGLALDGGDRLAGEVQAFFPAATIVIIAAIPQSGHELVEQIAFMAMQFDAGCAGFTRAPCRRAKALRQGCGLLGGQRPGIEFASGGQIVVIVDRRRYRSQMLRQGRVGPPFRQDKGRHDPAEAGGELHAEPAIVPTERLGESAHGLQVPVVGEIEAEARSQLQGPRDKDHLWRDQPDTTGCPRGVIGDGPVTPLAVLFHRAAYAHRRHDDAVFQFQRADVAWLQ